MDCFHFFAQQYQTKLKPYSIRNSSTYSKFQAKTKLMQYCSINDEKLSSDSLMIQPVMEPKTKIDIGEILEINCGHLILQGVRFSCKHLVRSLRKLSSL